MTDHEKALEQLRAARAGARDRVTITDLTKQEAAWTLTVTDPVTEKELTGTFVSRMPTLKERTLANLLAAQQCGGVAWDSIPPETRTSVRRLAEFTLFLKERPAWFADPESFFTEHVQLAVYSKIVEHWNTFFRHGRSTDGGPAEGSGSGAPATPELG